jgi:hypothetical protein
MDATTFTDRHESVAVECEPGTRHPTATEPPVATKLSVEASLRSVFILVLMGAPVIGLISILRIWRGDKAAAPIYTGAFAQTMRPKAFERLFSKPVENSWSPSALSTSTPERVSGIKSASRRNWLAGPAG